MSTQTIDKMQVGQLMLDLERFPVVGIKTLFKEALDHMNEAGLGIVCITDDAGLLSGIMTDGDVRRKLIKVQKPFSAMFADDVLQHCINTPTTVRPETSIEEAVLIMGQKKIWDLPVIDDEKRLVGLLHLHPVVESLLGSNS